MEFLKLNPNRSDEDLKFDEIEFRFKQFVEKSKSLSPEVSMQPADILELISVFDFEAGGEARETFDLIEKGLQNGSLNFHHPKYFGVFNPSPLRMGVLGNLLASLYNPQLASRKSAPFAIEAESKVIQFFAERAGYSRSEGLFTSGGSEGQLMALQAALSERFENFESLGVKGCHPCPLVYGSGETHHSVQKAVKISGLGLQSMRLVETDGNLKLDPKALRRQIQKDLASGFCPLMVVGTLGSTSAGVIDDLPEIARICQEFQIWFHVDAAFGGALTLLDDKSFIQGLSASDSFIFDAHKWLQMPFGCSMLITQKTGTLKKSFSIQENVYMPSSSKDQNEPYLMGLPWSRRMAGLGVFLNLSVMGRKAWAETILAQMKRAETARDLLRNAGFQLLNETPLPVICFLDPDLDAKLELTSICEEINQRAGAFLTTTRLKKDPESVGRSVFRLSINNSMTSDKDLEEVVEKLKIVFEELKGCVVREADGY